MLEVTMIATGSGSNGTGGEIQIALLLKNATESPVLKAIDAGLIP